MSFASFLLSFPVSHSNYGPDQLYWLPAQWLCFNKKQNSHLNFCLNSDCCSSFVYVIFNWHNHQWSLSMGAKIQNEKDCQYSLIFSSHSLLFYFNIIFAIFGHLSPSRQSLELWKGHMQDLQQHFVCSNVRLCLLHLCHQCWSLPSHFSPSVVTTASNPTLGFQHHPGNLDLRCCPWHALCGFQGDTWWPQRKGDLPKQLCCVY